MIKLVLVVMVSALLVACNAPPKSALSRPEHVDLARFMGDWYVIGFIPLWPERHAHNGVENYQLRDDGKIDVSYRFNNGSFDGPEKHYTQVARVVPDTNNTAWEVQFFWPVWADYRIAYLSQDYSEVIVARQARDYVWLMSRSPVMADERYQEMLQRIAEMGYDVEAFERQPQRW